MPDPMLRSLHFVPGHRERFLEKIPLLGADRVVLELEDGVGEADKQEARENVRSWLESNGTESCWLRINALDSPTGLDDCEMLRSLPSCPVIVLPKVAGPEAVRELVAVLGWDGASGEVVALIEDYQGLCLVRETASLPEVKGVGLGLEDFLSGSVHDAGDLGPHAAAIRSELVLSAKSAGVAAIDTISTNMGDSASFQENCEQSRALGFDGRFLIHPSQVPIANSVYSPSKEMLAWAEKVAAGMSSGAAVGYQRIEGELLSPPKIAKARTILNARNNSTQPDETI